MGGDPARKRNEGRTAISVAELCDLYLEKEVAHKRPLTLKSDCGRIGYHIKDVSSR